MTSFQLVTSSPVFYRSQRCKTLAKRWVYDTMIVVLIMETDLGPWGSNVATMPHSDPCNIYQLDFRSGKLASTVYYQVCDYYGERNLGPKRC